MCNRYDDEMSRSLWTGYGDAEPPAKPPYQHNSRGWVVTIDADLNVGPDTIRHWRDLLDGVPVESAAFQAAREMDDYLRALPRFRGQARKHSLLESLANTFVGLLVSYLAWIPVSLYLLKRPWHPGEGLAVTLIFTVLSIARNYVLRRVFNRWT